jgi:adenine-specific DNA methylase
MHVYPKRLIEVDLPIKRISAHARREKSIRHGHISTLHIWWARRPLAACRAIICAALWPDPADPLCPEGFRDAARREMRTWASDHLKLLSEESNERFLLLKNDPAKLEDNEELRNALLDFIADFSNWDNSTVPEFLETSRALTQAAHEALGGAPGTRPLVVDPFAGGGSIPLEALRVGADAFASDLNPVAVLLNKVVLEYIPRYGQRLADEVRKWGEWIKKEAENELAKFYPEGPNGATPIAYLWARTIQCEGPGCGAEIPLIRSLWLARRANRFVALQVVANSKAKRVSFRIIEKGRAGWIDAADPSTRIENPTFDGTVKRGSATCPCCGYTTGLPKVKQQLQRKHGGTDSARLVCTMFEYKETHETCYALACDKDLRVNRAAKEEIEKLLSRPGSVSAVPVESTADYHVFVNRGPLYGMVQWRDYFASRQALALVTLGRLIRGAGDKMRMDSGHELSVALETCLAFAQDKCADYWNSCTNWMPRGTVGHLFARQAIAMTWDFPEANPISDFHCAWGQTYEWIASVCENLDHAKLHSGHSEQLSAMDHSLPDDSATALITDPPYYYSVQYADLADFFYVWLRRSIGRHYAELLEPGETPKTDEIIVQSPGHEFAQAGKNRFFYESKMRLAMAEARRILRPDGVGVVVFAHTSTSGWESQLQAMVDAGWVLTGSWPIDTERSARILALDRSVLASSVHLVCRPRKNPDDESSIEEVGDWRDVLAELPRRIHEWMPRLAKESVVGADAIFACLGPALEVFSRYSRVEKASGETVTLKEYLEHVWAAVSKEALTMVFEGVDASGFEEDGRLTAMWLWTLNAGQNNGRPDEETEEDADEEEPAAAKLKGYALEYDAARKIAQGLGAVLENLTSLVEIKGDTARLLPVAERTRKLFGKDEADAPAKRKRKSAQMHLGFEAELEEVEDSGAWGKKGVPGLGSTVLDRVHQSMILFAAGRGEALRRFLVDEGAGRDGRFWRLAQVLSYLYPRSSDEKRWIDGVLARKKGLGF